MQCHIKTCRRHAKTGQLMCRHHWFQLPKPLREAIWKTYGPPMDKRAYVDNVREAEKFINGEAK